MIEVAVEHGFPRGRHGFAVLLGTGSLVVLMIAGSVARAAALEARVDPTKAATVKAAYLLNFARYAQWPEGAFAQPDSPIVITQVGECEVANVLPDLVRHSDTVNGHAVEIRRIATIGMSQDREEFLRSIKQAHLLFVCTVAVEETRLIVEHLRGSNVLTVGDDADFADHGGMLGFVLQRDRIVFEANPVAIHASPVSISAKVLKLAQLVGEGESQ